MNQIVPLITAIVVVGSLGILPANAQNAQNPIIHADVPGEGTR
jgi:hypothetical protein